MKDTFTITKIERYKELGNLLVGTRYSESSNAVNWALVCQGSDLGDLSEYLKSNNYECLFKKGEVKDEVEVALKLNEEEKMFVGSYIPKEVDKLYDEFYVKIKDYLKGKEDYGN